MLPGLIIKRAKEECRTGLIAGTAGDRVVPANLTVGQVLRAKKSKGSVAGLNLKGNRPAHYETARGKGSRRDRPRTEAGRTETNCSGNSKAALGTGAGILNHVACHVECVSPGSREGSVQGVKDVRYLDARDASLVAVGTATVDGIRPGEGVVGDAAGESRDLSGYGRRGQGDVASIQGASQAHGGQPIKAIRTVDMHGAP